jgi:hypothetical protein
VERRSPKIFDTSLIFEEMLKLNYHPIGVNSPNLVTLLLRDFEGGWVFVKIRVARFFLTLYTKTVKNIPNYHNITK